MKVSLIDWTGKGAMNWDTLEGPPAFRPDTRGEAAVNLLLFTKNTRLTMSPGLLEEIAAWPWEKKLAELEYMSNTIPSSWEFVHYTWMIEGVSRGFTHQFVRSRTFSFAQQTMRVLDVSTGPGWDYYTGPGIRSSSEYTATDEKEDRAYALYHGTMRIIANAYESLIEGGVPIEDARGILPTNILTNIVASCNMRTFVELVHKRSSLRVQGEYRDVLAAMKAEVLRVHPWMSLFIDRTADRAADELQKAVFEFNPITMVISNMDGDSKIDKNKLQEFKTSIYKLLDQIRKVM